MWVIILAKCMYGYMWSIQCDSASLGHRRGRLRCVCLSTHHRRCSWRNIVVSQHEALFQLRDCFKDNGYDIRCYARSAVWPLWDAGHPSQTLFELTFSIPCLAAKVHAHRRIGRKRSLPHRFTKYICYSYEMCTPQTVGKQFWHDLKLMFAFNHHYNNGLLQ